MVIIYISKKESKLDQTKITKTIKFKINVFRDTNVVLNMLMITNKSSQTRWRSLNSVR